MPIDNDIKTCFTNTESLVLQLITRKIYKPFWKKKYHLIYQQTVFHNIVFFKLAIVFVLYMYPVESCLIIVKLILGILYFCCLFDFE